MYLLRVWLISWSTRKRGRTLLERDLKNYIQYTLEDVALSVYSVAEEDNWQSERYLLQKLRRSLGPVVTSGALKNFELRARTYFKGDKSVDLIIKILINLNFLAGTFLQDKRFPHVVITGRSREIVSEIERLIDWANSR